MKYVKIVIGFVLGVISLGLIVTTIYDMTQEKVIEEVVTFEVLTESTVTPDTFSLIDMYVIFDNNNMSINVKSMKINDNILLSIAIEKPSVYQFRLSDSNGDMLLNNDDTIALEGINTVIGDVWEITYEVTTPPIIDGTLATLLLLIPIVFIGGLLYVYYERKGD